MLLSIFSIEPLASFAASVAVSFLVRVFRSSKKTARLRRSTAVASKAEVVGSQARKSPPVITSRTLMPKGDSPAWRTSRLQTTNIQLWVHGPAEPQIDIVLLLTTGI